MTETETETTKKPETDDLFLVVEKAESKNSSLGRNSILWLLVFFIWVKVWGLGREFQESSSSSHVTNAGFLCVSTAAFSWLFVKCKVTIEL